MKEYEIMLIVSPDLTEDELKSEIEKIKNSASKNRGEAAELNVWQRRQLAYPIKKFSEGVYLLGLFKLPQGAPRELSKEWKLNPNILRVLILKKEK